MGKGVAAPTQAEVDAAVDAAWAGRRGVQARHARRRARKRSLWMETTGTHGIVLAGRPYHNDPEINHAIPELTRRASAWPCSRKTPSRTWARSSVPFAWLTSGCTTRASTPPPRWPPSAATSTSFS